MDAPNAILSEKHAVPILMHVMNNEGCMISDIQNSITKNYGTVRKVCESLISAGLMTESDSRDGKLVTRYYLTTKGVTAGMVLRYLSDMISDPEYDPRIMKKMVIAHYGTPAEKLYNDAADG